MDNTVSDARPVPALFLDRDGVINEDFGFVHRAEDFVLVPGIVELIQAADKTGYKVIVITNQSGIGRGLFTEDDFHRLTEHMKSVLAAEGARIDAVYFCPHHPTDAIGAYQRTCDCRKPAPGMILQAAKEHNLDLERSILIGDSARDIEAANAAGVGETCLFCPPGRSPPMTAADMVVDRLTQIIPQWA